MTKNLIKEFHSSIDFNELIPLGHEAPGTTGFSAEELLEVVKTKMEKYPHPEYVLKFFGGSYDNWPSIEVYRIRLETDKEYNDRLERERKYKEKQQKQKISLDEKERLEYERLKKKFEQ